MTLAGSLTKVLPGKIDKVLVYNSLEPDLGEELAPGWSSEVSWRLAGNLHLLRERRPVYRWTHQEQDEWVPAQVTKVERAARRDKRGFLLTFRILAGSSAGLFASQFWSQARCQHLGLRLGFTRRHGRYPQRDGSELLSLRMELMLDRTRSIQKPQIGQLMRNDEVSPTLWEHNRESIKSRARIDPGYVCPKDYPPAHLCCLCSVGQDACRMAVHPRSSMAKLCPRCGQMSPFDPKGAEMCENCVRYLAWNPEEDDAV